MITRSLSTKISGLSTITRSLSTKITHCSMKISGLSTKISGLSTITRSLSMKITHCSTPLRKSRFFCRISNPTSALLAKIHDFIGIFLP